MIKGEIHNKLIISMNIFDSNKANFEGGAIKWNMVEPLIYKDNIFINNSAIYGDNNAAFPYKIEIEYFYQNEVICFSESYNCYVRINNIASGSDFPNGFNFLIKDIYNETYSSIIDGLIYIIYCLINLYMLFI